MTLGKKIKTLRRKRNMNQKQLAETSQITQATISRIESGQVRELKSEALKRLAVALGVTVDYLVGRTTELTPTDIFQSDPLAKEVLRSYAKLSAGGRTQLENFIRFLESEEEVKVHQLTNRIV